MTTMHRLGGSALAWCAATVVLWTAGPATAGLTPILPSPGEPNLATAGGILDTLYGLGNLARIEDYGPGVTDELWHNPNGSASAKAKFAKSAQEFGYLPGAGGGAFGLLFGVVGTGYVGGPTVGFTHFETGTTFRFADDPDSAGGPLLWSSLMADNASGGLDHMVTWQIVGNAGFAGNTIGNYVVAFEDQNLGDADYNDLVVEVHEVSPVPEPGTLLLLGLGTGVAALRRRREG